MAAVLTVHSLSLSRSLSVESEPRSAPCTQDVGMQVRCQSYYVRTRSRYVVRADLMFRTHSTVARERWQQEGAQDVGSAQ